MGTQASLAPRARQQTYESQRAQSPICQTPDRISVHWNLAANLTPKMKTVTTDGSKHHSSACSGLIESREIHLSFVKSPSPATTRGRAVSFSNDANPSRRPIGNRRGDATVCTGHFRTSQKSHAFSNVNC